MGAYNTVFGYLAFVILHLTLGRRVHYLLILVMAQVLSIANAYAGYRLVVFQVEGQILKDAARFSSVYLVIFGANLLALPVLVEGAKMPVLLAQALIIAVSVAVSYLAHKHFSFRRPVIDSRGVR